MRRKLLYIIVLIGFVSVLAVSGCTRTGNENGGDASNGATVDYSGDFFRGNLTLEGTPDIDERLLVTFSFSPTELLKSNARNTNAFLKVPEGVLIMGIGEWRNIKIHENGSYIYKTMVIPKKLGTHQIEMFIQTDLPTGSQESNTYTACFETKETGSRILDSCK